MHTSSERIFLWIVRIGLFAIPLLPLYVSSSMLFPFITGKNFAFRIIVEIAFIFWLGGLAEHAMQKSVAVTGPAGELVTAPLPRGKG